MSKEEKQAIELLKSKKTEFSYRNIDVKISVEILLKLVEKQQKEIEERNIRLQEEINENCKLKTELYGNSISKDKIREKIKGLENIIEWEKPTYKETLDYTIDILKELLEE